MSEYLWGITHKKPSRKEAARMHAICREEGGYGFVEVNVIKGTVPSINNGEYAGWFSGPNRGSPFDEDLAMAVSNRIIHEAMNKKRLS